MFEYFDDRAKIDINNDNAVDYSEHEVTENNYARDSAIELHVFDAVLPMGEDTLGISLLEERLQNSRRLEYLDEIDLINENENPDEYLGVPTPKVNIYPEFCTTQDIGGVHSGSVMLCFKDDLNNEDDSLSDESDTSIGNMKRILLPARKDMKITGGQFYMPQFLPILMKKEMSKYFYMLL